MLYPDAILNFASETNRQQYYEIVNPTQVFMVDFDDEIHFIDYILDIHSEGIIKMFTLEYVYIGFLESTHTP